MERPNARSKTKEHLGSLTHCKTHERFLLSSFGTQVMTYVGAKLSKKNKVICSYHTELQGYHIL
jgi:hypothetical protein